MPLPYASLSGAMTAAVASALSKYLRERHQSDGPPLLDPIRPGTVRCSRSGAPWVTWSRYPDHPGAVWFRLMDVPPNPDDGYDGAKVVEDADGRPLGCLEGPLMLSMVRREWSAYTVNTGWNLGSEVVWS